MVASLLAVAALLVPATQAQQQLSVRPFASGLDALTAIASTPAEPRRLYAVEQVGRIVYLVNGRRRGTFLDIRNRVTSGGEQGLLSVAFHPNYRRNHRFYVDYTDGNGDTRVVEFRSRNGRAILSSARQLLFVDQPYANHNGGELQFDRNGFLYVGMGDGGSAGDPEDRAQNPSQRLGKLLRINPLVRGARWQTAALGRYFFGDYCSGFVWSLRIEGGHAVDVRRETFRIRSPTSFGEDAAGGLYLATENGRIYK